MLLPEDDRKLPPPRKQSLIPLEASAIQQKDEVVSWREFQWNQESFCSCHCHYPVLRRIAASE